MQDLELDGHDRLMSLVPALGTTEQGGINFGLAGAF